jgi:hypothetical protein
MSEKLNLNDWERETFESNDLNPEDQIEYGKFSGSKQKKLVKDPVVQSAVYSLRSEVNQDNSVDHDVYMRTGIKNNVAKAYFEETMTIHDLTQHIAVEPFLKANRIGSLDLYTLSQAEEIRQLLTLFCFPLLSNGTERSNLSLIKIPDLDRIQNLLKEANLELELYTMGEINDPETESDIQNVKDKISYLERLLNKNTKLVNARQKFKDAALTLEPYLRQFMESSGIERLINEKTIQAISDGKLNLTVEHLITKSQSSIIPEEVVKNVNRAISEYSNFLITQSKPPTSYTSAP